MIGERLSQGRDWQGRDCDRGETVTGERLHVIGERLSQGETVTGERLLSVRYIRDCCL